MHDVAHKNRDRERDRQLPSANSRVARYTGSDRSCWMSREPLYSVQSEMTSIYLKLNHLGLPCPVMLDNCSEYDLETRNALGRWITFLDVLIPLADIGDLELARRIVMDDMEVKFAP